jgi:carbonic anhydrase|tara:strand:+ start:108 stop:563 length:456 start_codon:yes stop_codon:yes gene_type:complete
LKQVPIEIIFDQGVGDIFTIRVAGNCLDTSTEGSLEYAVCHLHVKVLIIMGHEGCGAVGAARSSNKELEKQPKCLCDLLKNVKGGLDDTRLNVIQDEKAGDREAVVSNVKYQVGNLLLNQAVKNSVDKGELIVMGAFYNQSSGIVDFIEIH